MAFKRFMMVGCVAGLGLGAADRAFGAEGALEPIEKDWHHAGIFGTFDRAAAQRGFQVYREVCAACHGLDYIAFRNLQDIGFSEEQVRALAAEYQITDGPNDEGEMIERDGRPSDRIPSPYANEGEARVANGGALPPDLSLITKARAEGTDYLYSLLQGYTEPPAGEEGREGMYYNAYYPGHWIAMPPPLSEGVVTYTGETEASVEQMANDVTTFLTWAAEPTLEARKRAGLKVMLFLIILTALLYATKRKIWSDMH